MRILTSTALATLLLFGCDRAPAEPKVTVENAWVQPPIIEGRPGVAYFTLRTNNDPTKLVGVASPEAGRIELHETRSEGGVSRMEPAQDLVFDKELKFEAGGKHAMIFDLDQAKIADGKMTLTFTFEPAPPVTVEADVRKMGADHAGH